MILLIIPIACSDDGKKRPGVLPTETNADEDGDENNKPKLEICNNGIDDDGNGKIDYEDNYCRENKTSPVTFGEVKETGYFYFKQPTNRIYAREFFPEYSVYALQSALMDITGGEKGIKEYVTLHVWKGEKTPEEKIAEIETLQEFPEESESILTELELGWIWIETDSQKIFIGIEFWKESNLRIGRDSEINNECWTYYPEIKEWIKHKTSLYRIKAEGCIPTP